MVVGSRPKRRYKPSLGLLGVPGGARDHLVQKKNRDKNKNIQPFLKSHPLPGVIVALVVVKGYGVCYGIGRRVQVV